MKKKLMKKLLWWVEIMSTQLTGKLLDFVYLKKKLQINCNWFD